MNYLSRFIYSTVAVLTFIAIGYSQCGNVDVCLSLEGGNLNYESTADIAGFQFSHDGCVTGAGGGDAAAAGFTVSASGSAVLGFSFTGSVVPAGCGTLVEIDGELNGLDDWIISDSVGGPLEFSYYGDEDNGETEGCTDSSACNYNSDATDDEIYRMHLDAASAVTINAGTYDAVTDKTTFSKQSG